jgi:Protein of unknown function (DUF3048) N-terminal domain
VALSTRGKTLVGVLSVIVLAGAAFVGFRLLTKEEGEPIIPGVPILGEEPTCPLTGEEAPSESVLGRPALAIKVENIDEARPQSGLLEADIIWEEEAEGGITRFIAVYHCQDATRVGPVRSARPVDPPILMLFRTPLFGYAGGVAKVEQEIAEAGVIDLNYIDAAEAYTRDPNRSAPHDLYTTTQALRREAGGRGRAPEALFTYEDDAPERKGTRPGREIVADWSIATDVVWRYRSSDGLYRRFHGEEAHFLEAGRARGDSDRGPGRKPRPQLRSGRGGRRGGVPGRPGHPGIVGASRGRGAPAVRGSPGRRHRPEAGDHLDHAVPHGRRGPPGVLRPDASSLRAVS